MAVRLAKCTGKSYTLRDTKGLFFSVRDNGCKSWHFRYLFNGKEKRMSFGHYPAVSLKQARDLCEQAHALLAHGVDPVADRRDKRLESRIQGEHTFQVVYERWYEHKQKSLKQGHNTSYELIPQFFSKNVLPSLSKRSIYSIRRADLLDVLSRIEDRGATEVAKKVRTWFNQMFRFALVYYPKLEFNPATDLDVVAMPQPPVRHNPHLKLEDLPTLLQRLRIYPGRFQTQLGLRFLLLTAVRTCELREATPEQFDLEQKLWKIPPEIVKQLQLEMRRKRIAPRDIPPYIVPLSVQAMEIVQFQLCRMKPGQRYLFRHDWKANLKMSENTLNQAIKRLGYDGALTGHGIRGTISTALNEIGYPDKWVDAQLSHADPNKDSEAYNHAQYIEQRRRMMQDWADRLDLLEQGEVEAAMQPLNVQPRFDSPIVMAEGEQSQQIATKPTLVSRNAPTPKVVQLFKQALTEKVAPTTPPALEEAPTHDTLIENVPTAVRLSALALPQPPMSDEQRARMELLDIFMSSHNLPVADFARMAGKSGRWINYEVAAGNLLDLRVGNRGRRIPDWHFDPPKHALIQAVLKLNQEVDHWKIYFALLHTEPSLGDRAAIDSLARFKLSKLVQVVCKRIEATAQTSVIAA
jgi:integrase